MKVNSGRRPPEGERNSCSAEEIVSSFSALVLVLAAAAEEGRLDFAGMQ